MSCNCVNSMQDILYGSGKRVFNRIAKQDGKVYRCTVCLSERTPGESLEPKKKKK